MIRIRNLNFSYKEEPVLRKVDVEIKKGEFIGIMGATGSGKSTFAMCLNGIIPNSVQGKFSGDVEICGKNSKSSEVFDLAKSVGMVFQDPDFQIFSLEVSDEVSFGPENLGLGKGEIQERVDSALEMVGIKDLKYRETFALSVGQKQKVCIASVLAMNPDILVLDEPTSQLDFRSTKEIYGILKDLHGKGKTIIIIEHKVDWLLEYADRILVLDGGKFILDGKPPEVFKNFEILERIGIETPKVLRLERFLKKKGIKTDLKELLKV
ncbi:MAG: ABC transporter ATP-binding protein [Candidatus Aenigmarchaeota archaeon]